MILLDELIMDYMNANSSTVLAFEVQRLQSLLDDIKQSGRLCTNSGHQVVAEFNIHGTPEKIISFLECHITNLKNMKHLTRLDRTGMVVRMSRGQKELDYLSRQSDIHIGMMQDMFNATEDVADIDLMVERYNKNKDIMHERKECLCHCNY